METPDHIRQLKIVGGNLAFDFLNTVGGPHGGPLEDEALRGYDDVVAWAQHVGILSEPDAGNLMRAGQIDPKRARSTYKRAMRLRHGLYELFSATAAGQQLPGLALAQVRNEEALALRHAELVGGQDGYDWSWAHDDDLARPLHAVVHAAVALLTTGPLERVKQCASCRWWFVDESKNGSRRWCAMEDCGTAEKVRRYVARRAVSRSARTVRTGPLPTTEAG